MVSTAHTDPNLLATTKKYVTRKLPTKPPATEVTEGPSWGLIIPIVMIVVFLVGVCLCLWWHKWRGKRSMHLHRDSMNTSAFQRSYRRSRSSRNGLDSVRDSQRSTAPVLRSSISEKISVKNNNLKKINNANVVPVPVKRSGNNPKYAFHWDKTHWKAYPPQHVSSIVRPATKPLSPINEIESPGSIKISELSQNYELSAQAGFSPYHLTWTTPSSKIPLQERSGSMSQRGSAQTCRSCRSHMSHMSSAVDQGRVQKFQNNEVGANSPFFPNNNTPTTECDTGSEASQHQFAKDRSSNMLSYPLSPKSAAMSGSNFGLSLSTDTDTTYRTSYTSYEHDTFHSSHNQSGLHPSSTYPSNHTSHTNPSTNYSSLPSSIAQFSKQNTIEDLNNNSMLVPNAYISYPVSKTLNYTLASSLASSDTHVSDNTSLLPNVGSSNTSGFPTALSSHVQSVEPSGHASPEDLSKLVNEMSSIRPAEELSTRPSSSVDPSSRIMSISDNLSSDFHRSWSIMSDVINYERRGSVGSMNVSSQNASLMWDNYPLELEGSGQYSSNSLHESLMQQAQQYGYHIPVLSETQYWV